VVLHDYALYKSTFTLLYFIGECTNDPHRFSIYKLSLANASNIKLIIRSKMSVFVKFYRNQEAVWKLLHSTHQNRTMNSCKKLCGQSSDSRTQER